MNAFTRIILTIVFVSGFLFAPANTARAATLTVTTNADSGAGSLRSAIAAASNGDTITFDNDYTITLASQLQILDKTITITGAGHHITISGNNAVRVFQVGDYNTARSGNLTIDHLNIVNGKSQIEECSGSAVACAGGLLVDYLATATVLNSTFANNDGGLEGGAIYSYYGSPLTVINSTFINNKAIAYGGAIGVFYGSASLTNNTFYGNILTNPGGFGSGILNTWGTVTFRNNIFVKGATSVNMCDSDYSDGGSTNDGGGNVRSGDTTCPGTTVAPMLGTLGNYGGGVLTLPLLPGSGAFSAASTNCPAVDARGVTRAAVCDPGAYESNGFTLNKTGGDGQLTQFGTAFAAPLALSVIPVHAGDAVDGGVVSFTAPASGASAVLTGSPATITGGAASVSTTANGVIGGPYLVTASTTGADSVSFSLRNTIAPPTGLTATPVSPTQINLAWSDNSASETGFKIYRNGSLVTTTAADSTSYNDTELTCNTLYHYEVNATDASGDTTGTTASATTWACEPATQASAVTFSNVSQVSMTVGWTNGSGSDRIVLVKSASEVNSNPVDGSTYTVSPVFGDSSQIGSGNYVVYQGSGSSVTITGLAPETVYYVAVYEFNGSAGAENYLTASPAVGNQETLNYTYYLPTIFH